MKVYTVIRTVWDVNGTDGVEVHKTTTNKRSALNKLDELKSESLLKFKEVYSGEPVLDEMEDGFIVENSDYSANAYGFVCETELEQE